jgi:hypothetical protein
LHPETVVSRHFDPELISCTLKAYEGQEDSDEHADLDWTPVSPEMVGNKWLVVVDYHT